MNWTKATLLFLILSISTVFKAQTEKAEKYISEWKDVAIQEMIKYNIPASITLAQAILESGYGESMLSLKANNHFGIKCHDWNGKKVYHDDDKKGECFRHYKDATESFDDHSKFLAERSRYNFLFEFKSTDYKSWAKGLKKAGYATNPKYPNLLIDLIEKYKLYQYDEEALDLIKKDKKGSKNKSKKKDKTPSLPVTLEEAITINIGKLTAYRNANGSKFVICGENDTYQSIAKNFDLEPFQLYTFNDVKKGYKPNTGERVYIYSKKKEASVFEHTVNKGETLWSISQVYGIKIKSIVKYNKIKKKNMDNIQIGQKLVLQKL